METAQVPEAKGKPDVTHNLSSEIIQKLKDNAKMISAKFRGIHFTVFNAELYIKAGEKRPSSLHLTEIAVTYIRLILLNNMVDFDLVVVVPNKYLEVFSDGLTIIFLNL